MPPKNKKARHKEKVTGAKSPKFNVNPDAYLNKNPVWVFHRSDCHHKKWGLFNCKDFCNTILSKLISFERMTWAEIQNASSGRTYGTNNHNVKICDMTKEAQKRARKINLNVDELFSLRLDGKTRLYGIIEDGVYNIIWYTNNHDICLSYKKHT